MIFEAWAPESDRAKTEFNDRWEAERTRVFSKNGANSSAPYQVLAKFGEQLFSSTANALRDRVRALLDERELSNIDAEKLAHFLVESTRSTAENAVDSLLQVANATGFLNINYISKPVAAAKSRIDADAKSITTGLAEDIKARVVRRHSAEAKNSVEKSYVITLHGIETAGRWQKMLTSPLASNNFVPVSMDYGRFLAIELMLPFRRRNKLAWFLNEYRNATKSFTSPPSLIAHSFGTYIAAEAMRKYPEIRFDQIVFCGSIVEVSYPWAKLHGRGQFNRLLNESGGRDVPVRIVQWVVRDAGPSGSIGFAPKCPAIIEDHNAQFAHSDAFYEARVSAKWVPFLRGDQLRENIQIPQPAFNVRFSLVVVLFLLVAGAIFSYWLYHYLLDAKESVVVPVQKPAAPPLKRLPDTVLFNSLLNLPGDAKPPSNAFPKDTKISQRSNKLFMVFPSKLFERDFSQYQIYADGIADRSGFIKSVDGLNDDNSNKIDALCSENYFNNLRSRLILDIGEYDSSKAFVSPDDSPSSSACTPRPGVLCHDATYEAGWRAHFTGQKGFDVDLVVTRSQLRWQGQDTDTKVLQRFENSCQLRIDVVSSTHKTPAISK